MPRVVIYGCKQVTAAADVFWNLEGDDKKFGKSGIDRNSCFPFETVLGSKARRLESSFLISSLMRNSWVLRLAAAPTSTSSFSFFFFVFSLESSYLLFYLTFLSLISCGHWVLNFINPLLFICPLSIYLLLSTGFFCHELWRAHLKAIFLSQDCT